MKKNLWLSTALVLTLIATTQHATAQQYIDRYKTTDKPSVEVDMGALSGAPAQPQAAPAPAQAPAATSPLANVNQQELLDAASEDTPDKKLDKPFFTQMSPAAITGDAAPAAEAPAPVGAVKHAPKKVAAVKKRIMGVPPKPRHKPRTATVSIPDNKGLNDTMAAAAPVAQEPKQPVLMLSLPSHMPALAVDQAKMPPIGTAAPIVAPQPTFGLTQDETAAAPRQQAVQKPAAPARPLETSIMPVAKNDAAPKMQAVPPTPVASVPVPPPAGMVAAPAPEEAPHSVVIGDAPAAAPVPASVPAAPIAAPSTAATTPTAPVQPATSPAAPQNDSLIPPDTREMTAAQVADAQEDMKRALRMSGQEPAPAPDAAAAAAPASTNAAAATDTIAPLQNATPPVVPTLSDLTLSFAGNSSDLSPDAQKKLDNLVTQLNSMTDGRIQVRGFATGENGSQTSARRISLSRVLSVRSYLMDKGIKPTRVDVRAQGSDTDRSPLDRVDLLFER